MTRPRWNWLILPMLVAFGAIYVPAIMAFVLMSFHVSTGIATVSSAWSIDNYIKVLGDPVYQTGLERSLALGVATVVGVLVLGFPLAYYISRFPSRLALTMFTLLYISSLTGIVIRGLGWITLLANTGPINRALLAVGLISQPIELEGNLIGLSLAMIHYTLPYMVLTLVPVMHAVPTGLEEAAEGLGAGFLTTMRTVLLPLAMPGVIAGSLLVFAMTISSFVMPRMIGGPTLLLTSLLIDQQMRTTFDWGVGSTLSAILLLLVAVVVALASLISMRRTVRA